MAFCLLHTGPELVRLLAIQATGQHGILRYAHSPTSPPGHSEGAGVEWGFFAKVAKGSDCQLVGSKGVFLFAWLIPSPACLPVLQELGKGCCNGPGGEVRE